MARDDHFDPPTDRPTADRPPTLGPRQLRASLSSSLGLDDGRRGSSRLRIEPRLGGASAVSPVEVPPPADTRFDADEMVEMPAGEAQQWTEEPDERQAVTPRPVETRPETTKDKPGPRHGAKTSGSRPHRSPRVEKSKASTSPQATKSQTIVPPQAVAGRALVSVVAIMCFLACLAVGALSLVIGAAHDWQLDVSREVTIQVKPVDGTAMTARLARALDIARATTGVRSARLISEAESAALLEPWLGQGLDLSSLPIPRLVVLDLGDPAGADLAGLKSRIGAEISGAVVDDHAVWAARLRTMAGAVVAVGVMIVLLVFVAMVLSVVFATQSAMAGNREVIEVLHFVGAEDSFIARQFQQHFLKLGLKGGAIGGAAAIVCFIAADMATRSGRGDALADQAHALFGGFSVGFGGHLAAAAVVGIVAMLTAITSRATVLGHLRRID